MMELAIPRKQVQSGQSPQCAVSGRVPAPQSPGVNVRPGPEDDGWVSPPPIVLSDHTRIQLFKDGEGLRAAYDAIRAAERFICLEVYIFASDETGRAFADLLCEKARQGVRVYLIYDAFGSIESDRQMFKRMRQAGVRVQVFHPIRPWECQFSWRPFNRDHRKLVVIDDRIAGLGGLNIGDEYAGPWIGSYVPASCEFWRDNAIGIVGPSAQLFRHAFANTWHYIAHGGRIRRAEFIHHLHEGELGVMALTPTLNSPLRPFLHHMLREAKESILMTMAYFAPDDPLLEGLCKAAKRGVRVRLMLPGKCDVPVVRLCGRAFYEMMLHAGIEIFERQGVILHTKAMVVDGHTSILGSTNLDYRSIEYNCELSAIIRSAPFGRQMQDLFKNDIGFSRPIKLSAWRRRPHIDRFVQWAVSRARYLL
jgi:cardiolipin synthase A/B